MQHVWLMFRVLTETVRVPRLVVYSLEMLSLSWGIQGFCREITLTSFFIFHLTTARRCAFKTFTRTEEESTLLGQYERCTRLRQDAPPPLTLTRCD